MACERVGDRGLQAARAEAPRRSVAAAAKGLALLVIVAGHGCAPGPLRSRLYGELAARLSVSNAAVALALVSADERCGFMSPEVIASATQDAPSGTFGTITHTIAECVIDVPVDAARRTDCQGTTSSGGGRFTVRGTREIHGQLTGVPEQPVVPGGPDAVVFRLEIEPETLTSGRTGADLRLINTGGTLAFTARPRLAVGATLPGVCATPTPNVSLEGLTFQDATATLVRDGGESHIEISEAALEIQVGVGAPRDDGLPRENSILGTMTVFGHELSFDESDAFDPTYERDVFLASYSAPNCSNNDGALAFPLTYVCEGIGPLLAFGTSRLAVRTMGALAGLLERDTSCGFGAVEPTLRGTVGGPGSGLWEVRDCVIDLPSPVVIGESCDGDETTASGRVRVSGRRLFEGFLGGDPRAPVIPNGARPVEIVLDEIVFEDFEVSGGGASQRISRGRGSARIVPRLAATTAGVCAQITGNTEVLDVRIEDAVSVLRSEQGTFESLVEVDVDAVAGRVGGRENHISGHVDVDGARYELEEVEGGEALDPDYDAATYQASWASCAADLVQPISEDCELSRVLAPSSARLAINTFGQVAAAAVADTECGFASRDAIDSALVEGEVGRDGGVATYRIDGCRITFEEGTRLGESCIGAGNPASGSVVVSGTMVLRGIHTGDRETPIVPTSWEPTELRLRMDFESTRVGAGDSGYAFELIDGSAAGVVRPRLALDAATGACSRPTPVVTVEELVFTPTRARVHTAAAFIEVQLGAADLFAVNGATEDLENVLEGRIELGGETFELPLDGAGLNPFYDEESFYDPIACLDDVVLPTRDEDCSFNRTLGEGAARLLLQHAGYMAGAIAADSVCGFGAVSEQVQPDRVEEYGDGRGALTFRTAGCQIDRAQEEQVGESCDGARTLARGGLTFTGSARVEGRLGGAPPLLYTVTQDTPESTTLTAESAVFRSVSVRTLDASGEPAQPAYLVVQDGTMAVVLRPIFGESASERGTYSVPTPVAAIEGLRMDRARASLRFGPLTFALDLEDVAIDAFNGAYGGRMNELAGALTVNGERVVIEPQPLVEGYDQAAFDDGYSCAEDLHEPVRP